MPSTQMLESLHLVKGLDPAANAFAATVYSDVVNLSHYDTCMFIVYIGVGAVGTATLTVEASDDVSGSNVVAIPYYYRVISTGDTEGTLTAAAATGFTTTAGSSKLIAIEVSAQDLVPSGYKYCRLKSVEVVANAVLGGILVVLGAPRYGKAEKTTAIV